MTTEKFIEGYQVGEFFRLEIKNARDKFISYSSGNNDNIVAYSYLASGAKQVDGCKKY